MKKQFFLLAILFLSSICFTKAYCQLNVYVQFSGITSSDKGHNGGFLVTSFETTDSTNIINIGATGGGAGAGKVSFGTAKLQKLLDPATNPTIMMDLASGKLISSVTITWYNSGSTTPFYQIVLGNVLFQSVSILSPSCNTSTNCNNLFEEIHLAYAKIQWKGSTTSPSGNPTSGPTGGWDITTNKSF